ncbi:MAG: tol-pal system protein YbgF [Pseudomonadales bacterium]|nr:tol-pal system protein YbgF [Pseudomonadales bacterium]
MRVFGIASLNLLSACNRVEVRVLVMAAAVLVAPSSTAESRYDPLPVEQREAVDTNYPSAAGYDSQLSTNDAPIRLQNATPAVSVAPLSAGNVQVNKPLISSGEQWELYSQMQQMQDELQMLRGSLERQAHELEQMKRQQRERYLDLDHRIGQLRKSAIQEPAIDIKEASVSKAPAVLSAEDQVAKDVEQYDAAYQLLKERNFAEAILAFKALLADSPGGKKAPYCEYWLGELHLANTPADLDSAKTHFVRLLTQYPSHGKVPDGMYKLGTVFDKAGDKAKASVTLKRVMKDFSGSQAAKLAKSYLKGL